MGETLATFPSSSNPSKVYRVQRGADGVIYCDCTGWKMRKTCKHLAEFHSSGGTGAAPETGIAKNTSQSTPLVSAKETRNSARTRVKPEQASVPEIPAMPKDGPMFTGKIDPGAFRSELFQSQPWYQGCGDEAEGDAEAMKQFLIGAERIGWSAEPKMDGINITCFGDGEKNRFWSRNMKEKPYGLSELPIPAGTILIGELGFGSEHALQRRAEYGYDFMDVYGILAENYESLLHLDDAQMRRRLERFVINLPGKLRQHFKLVPRFTKNLVAEFEAQHEGLVVKKPSKYQGRGLKVPEWIKVKKWMETDMVVMDLELSTAKSKAGMTQAVICGQYVDGKLKPLVKVGSMTSAWSREFANNFSAYKGKVMKISHFGQFSSGSLRHPSMVDMRDDKAPESCVFEKRGKE